MPDHANTSGPQKSCNCADFFFQKLPEKRNTDHTRNDDTRKKCGLDVNLLLCQKKQKEKNEPEAMNIALSFVIL